MSPKHTNWIALETEDESSSFYSIVSDGRFGFTQLAKVDSYSDSASIAQLMASAPDLLEALQDLTAWTKDSNRHPDKMCDILARAENAIAKALDLP